VVIYVRHWQRDQLGGVFPFHLIQRDDAGIRLWAPAATRGWLFDMPDGRRLAETPLSSWSSTRRVPVPNAVDHGTLAWHPSGRDYSIRWFFRPDGTFTRWYGNLEAPAALSPNFPAAASSLAPGAPPSSASGVALPPVAGASPSSASGVAPSLAPGAPPSSASAAAPSLAPGVPPSSASGAAPSPASDLSLAGAAFLDTVDWDLDVVIRPDRTWEWKDEEIFTERLAAPESYWVHDEPRVRKAGLSVIDLAEAGDFPFDGTWCDFRPDPSWPPLPSELPPGYDAPPHW
jgi:hypothetical protein